MPSLRTNFALIPIAMLSMCGDAVAAVSDANAPAPEPAVAADSPAGAEPSSAIAHAAENAVVKVFSTVAYPDFTRPWGK